MMDQRDIKAQTDLGQKLAGVFGTMGWERSVYVPENDGDGGSASVSTETTKSKLPVLAGPTKGYDL